MSIDLRQDAPDQSDVIDPKKLSEEIEKLKSIQTKILTLKAQIKDLEEDEKYFVYDVIPKLMYDMNLSTLKLKDGSEVSVGKKFYANARADKEQMHINGFETMALVTLLKIILVLLLVKAKKTRLWLTLTLQRSMVTSLLKKKMLTMLLYRQ